MRRSNHENIDVLMLIGLVTGEEGGEGEGKSNSKVGTRWVRQLQINFKLTCYEDRNQHGKVGEHLQPNHPNRLLEN